jgi:DNA polymerase III subunit gamma/tau
VQRRKKVYLAGMDNFVVSARKYRPQNFSTVVGQQHITTTLKNAIKNSQLAHAFLFCGPRGVGKTTCARILAKTINCLNPTADAEACNVCSSCQSFDGGASLNIHELDAASNNSVDDIRSLVEQVRFAPQAGKYKVYIVDEVHMLTASAFNAFLKTLEEPPSYAIFILATTEKHKILPTILSRCQIFDFKRITAADTVSHLQEICSKEAITAEQPALHLIAQKSEGCMRDSLSILDKIVSFTNGALTYKNTLEHLNVLDETYYFDMLDFVQQQDVASSLLMYDEINAKGFEGDTVLNGLAAFFRNLLVSKDKRVASLLETADDFKQRYAASAATTDAAFIIAALNLLNDAELAYKQAKNKRLHIELALIKLCYLQQAMELSFAGDNGLVKKKLAEGSRTLQFRALPIVKPGKMSRVAEAPAQLIIETAPVAPAPAPAQYKTAPANDANTNSTAATADTTPQRLVLGSLAKIKAQIQQQSRQTQAIIPLSEDDLHAAWGQYITVLKNKANNAAVTIFKAATLQLTDENSFLITTDGEIAKGFIELERPGLIAHLQQYFNNRNLTYQLLVEEASIADVPVAKQLTKKEQYLKVIEEYPLVKELREKLKMDIE